MRSRLWHGIRSWPLLLWLILAGPWQAQADDAPPLEACVDQLDDQGVAELLTFTEQSLRDQRLGASLWYGGWMAFNLTNVGVASWRLAVVDKQVEWDGWLLSAVGAGAFVIMNAVLPPPALYASMRVKRLPGATPGERRVKLRHALNLLQRANAFELRNTSWLTHIGGWFYGVASLLYMYLHNLHAEDMRTVHIASWIQFGSTVAGAELTIWTVPRKARRDVAQVRAHGCSGSTRGRLDAPTSPSLSIAAAGPYLGLRLRF
ncbi:MAG TPA: hypothetical protein VFZ61_13940 [Polyangiales bacterium]